MKDRTAWYLGIAALIYYAVLSAKTWTWIFVGMDSGDYLSSILLNMTPHAYGMPLYIMLGKILAAFPLPLVNTMTMLLSVVPGAVIVGLTYPIVKKAIPATELQAGGTYRVVRGRSWYAFIAALVVMAAAVLLTQATILEIYALAVMFLTLAVYYYQRQRYGLWLAMLGLGMAVHVIIGVIAVVWVAIEWRNYRKYLPAIPLFILFGLAPYAYTLWSMSLDTPKLFGGDLTIAGVLGWAGGTDRIGTLSVFDAPVRALQLAGVVLSTFGLAIVPMVKGIAARKAMVMGTVAFAVVFLSVFLYATNLDMTTWTYLIFGIPFAAMFIGYGLYKMTPIQVAAVALGAVALFYLNADYLNADKLTKEQPLATEYQKALMELPDGAAVIIPSGSTTGSGLYYVMVEKDLVPIILTANPDANVNYSTYLEQMQRWYGITGSNPMELAQSAILSGRTVYFAQPLTEYWGKAFITDGASPVSRVTVVNLAPDWTGLDAPR